MKFLHTADWQVGMRAAHVAGRGAAVREERVAAARRIVNAAIEHDAEFIVVAGDTFEDNAVDRLLVQRVADVLGTFPRRLFLLPGNHDPLVAGSVWEHLAWTSRPNLHVCRDPLPIDVPGGTLWPCPLRDRWGTGDPTAGIPPRDASHGIRVAIAHGSIEGVSAEDRYHPIPRDVDARRDVDYVALGHWHSLATISPRVAYSGTPEPTKFGERDSGSALIIEIAAVGAAPILTPVSTGRLQWQQWHETCTDDDAVTRLVTRVESIAAPGETLLEILLDGILPANRAADLERLRQVATSRLFHTRIDADMLRPAPNDDTWLAGLPAGAVHDAARQLQAWADASAMDRPAGVDAAIAARALLELYLIAAPAGGAAR